MNLRLIKGAETGSQHDPSNFSSVPTEYETYEAFFYATFASFKKDVFSGELLVKEDGSWQSIKNQIRLLRSYAQETDGLIKPQRIEDHLARFSKKFRPELLIDIPEHDGTQDVLRDVCNCVHPVNITQDELYELLLEWGANMWLRFESPTHQNKVLILQSAQGVGKDYLLRAMFGALEQFFINFTVTHNERENLAVLNQGLVINISEFDRTSRMNTGLLKDMITRDSTFVRLPFEKCAVKRAVRCSFVGSCNTRNILTDTTGNRRYVVIEIDKIDRNYPNNSSLEILAQFKAAAKTGYKASFATLEKMNHYIQTITPKAPTDEVLDIYDSFLDALATQNPQSKGIFDKQDIQNVLSEIELECKLSEKKILRLLNENGRSHRTSNGMIYGKIGIALRYRETQRAMG